MLTGINSRKIVPLPLVLLVLAAMHSGCKNDDSLSTQDVLTESDVATIVVNSFGSGSSTYGLTGQIEELVGLPSGGSLGKTAATQGALFDTAIVTRQRSGVFNYNYQFQFIYGLVSPNEFDVFYSMAGVYEVPRMSSDDSAHASFQITNLAADTLKVNGEYLRSGSQTSKVGEQKQFSSEIHAVFTNISVLKASKKVTGGTVVISVTGRFEDGTSVTLDGTLTFLDNHQATLLVNGKLFNLNLDYVDATLA